MKQLSWLSAVAVCAALLMGTSASAQCPADTVQGFRSVGSNDDFHDYGLLFAAARSTDSTCLNTTVTRFRNKLAATPDSQWQTFLSGAWVSYVMSTALELGGKGPAYFDADLDAKVAHVARAYVFYRFPPGDSQYCGLSGGNWQHANSCMDDYTIAVSGFGWVAAYLRLTGRDWQSSRDNTINYLHKSFDVLESICINVPGRAWVFGSPYTGPCDGSPSDLGPNLTGQLLSLNHGNQTPAYGLGLMTSVAAGFDGLDAAGARVDTNSELSSDERKIAEYLFREGQNHYDPNRVSPNTSTYGDFDDNSCVKIENYQFVAPWGCFDQNFEFGSNPSDITGVTGYRAKWYPLKNFYTAYGLTTGDPNKYQFDAPFLDTFVPTSQYFFGPGRKETYKTFGNDWVSATGRPALNADADYTFALKSFSPEYYLSAEGGGNGDVNANRTAVGPWETFVVHDLNGGTLQSGDQVTIRTSGNYYWSAQDGGGSSLNTTATAVGWWETFVIIKQNGSGPIAHGDKISLQTGNGHYVVAESGGGTIVKADRTAASVWETFTIESLE